MNSLSWRRLAALALVAPLLPLSACGDTDQSAGPGMTEDAATAGDDGAGGVPTATDPMGGTPGDTTGTNPAANAGATGMGTDASGDGGTGLGAGTDAAGTTSGGQ